MKNTHYKQYSLREFPGIMELHEHTVIIVQL